MVKLKLCFFTLPKKQLDGDLKIELNEKMLYKIDSVSCLEIEIDKRLTWKQQMFHVALNKLNKANVMLS